MSTERRRLADRYELEDRIGRGGMGEVWRATDTVLHRRVAVKTIDLRTVPDESGHARFEREARVTAGMSHPNIVTVHDSGVEDDTAYLVMELLPGPSLAERLREGPLPVDEVEQIGLQVATALDAAHARGLVHRDIKPGNIVHAADGRVRVLDFGITQLGETTGSQALTATHTVMGTAEYLAPEQALGGRVDGRADLYALGCVLYALLAGRPPFQGPSPVATMMMHANDPVPDVRQARPDTPPWLAGLVASLLAKDPDARPAGAASVAAAIERHEVPGVAAATTVLLPGEDDTRRLDSTPAPVPAPPPTHRPPDRRGSSAPLWVLAAVAVLALALLGWWAWASRSEPTATPTVTTTTATTAAPTTQAPATSAPAPSTASPTPTEDPAQAVTDALAAFSAEVGALEQDGTLDKDVAKDLDAGVRDLEKALRDGDAAAVSGAMDALTQRYDEGVQDGTVTPDAADRLDPLLADLQAAVDGYTG
jgi:eukaryotic-like serine/threonine-protein kinase